MGQDPIPLFMIRRFIRMSEILLEARNINKYYGGVIALSNLNFVIKKGEVHCLVGENGSGKSTLVKIITGVVQPEPGAEIIIDGVKFTHLTPLEAFKNGIQVVHQDFSLFPNLSVAENISIAQYIKKFKPVNWKEINSIAKETMNKLGINLSLNVPVNMLSIADQQLVAICRSLASEAKLIIMDEPTSSLTREEVEHLFKIIKDLKNQGISILFISHKLDEVLEIGEVITVLRDGKKIATVNRDEVDKQKLTFLMTGKEVVFSKNQYKSFENNVVLEVKGLYKKGQFSDINFKLNKGEVLGIIGPLGSGKTELALSLFGMNPPDKGEIYLQGKRVKFNSNIDAIKNGIGYVPEDRLNQGLVLNHSVENNIVITILSKLLNRFRLIDSLKKRNISEDAIKRFNIKCHSLDAPVKSLSGGNQQKVVIAKWFLTLPKILILDGPTVGVDVLAKNSIYETIKELVSHGVSIILISDEIYEVLNNCNRILIMKKGKIVDMLYSEEITEEELYQKVWSKEDKLKVL
jgi:simple sugar transport system ATP-binding protein